jgi:hypothetical protein
MNQALTISDNIKILSGRIETEVNRLSNDTLNDRNQTDSLLYIGNWQDAIPRSIWVDVSLNAMDVRSWGIIRTQAVNGSAVILSINHLLKDTLGYSNATVSRVIYVLRLTRWISLCSKLRTDSGKFRGNIYAIHDNPVLLDDAIYLDSHYIEFVKKQTSHRNNAIRTLAQSIWQLIAESVHHENTFLSASSETGIIGSLNYLVNSSATKTPKTNYANHVYNLNRDENSQVYKLNVDTKHPVHFLNVDEEKNEIDENQSDSNHVHILNVDTICSSRCSSSSLNKKDINKKTPTTNSAGISKQPEKKVKPELIYPKSFNANENKLAKRYLQKIEPALQQSFLDETAAQIKQRSKTNNPIRNPIGYLAWLCSEHGKGNTYLTSASLKHQEQRERAASHEQKIKQQQQELTQAALNGKWGRAVEVNKKKNTVISEERQKTTKTRWGGINRAFRPKNHCE